MWITFKKNTKSADEEGSKRSFMWITLWIVCKTTVFLQIILNRAKLADYE